MYKVEVFVTYKESILDPQGEAIKGAVGRMGYTDIAEIRQGKYFEIVVESDDEAHVAAEIEAISDKLLANVVMESYRYNIQKVEVEA
ncbi:phosphoribosylformylglycinamidine synthase subunit PurS [Aerococcus agrisoli]|uniref:Phosphoribosylformylglycinamidine synthase subunit PurS n=1 Tax=Aerococcus agrisoli TaxID=2487350 RepID=A0A3N4G8Q3_9LACT|nr:phosphoribosylformylglycinamidine synthase subunit PurS [Aerococcus agrisoli]RPA58458.1 phosphoribosylformylglycinamidine synthase subunit PurS [Aerococcus agrisoli]